MGGPVKGCLKYRERSESSNYACGKQEVDAGSAIVRIYTHLGGL